MTIKVKVLSRSQPINPRLTRQLPTGWSEANGLDFVFDPDARVYDWLVVYDDLPRSTGITEERLACPPENTLLVTSEPSGVKVYGRSFVRQFGHVLTSQEPIALRHPGRIWHQAGLTWFYGMDEDHNDFLSVDEIAHRFPEKTETVATVCSSKRQSHTLHRLRYDFTEYAARHLPELQVFGHGRRYMDDKAEAIDRFRYHLAIENHVAPHHITEKLSDPFLGLSLPFYFGAPNVFDYFPAESVIPVDIRKPAEAVTMIRAAIDSNEYEKRLPAIIEARRRVIEDYNFFSLVSQIVHRDEAARYIPDVTRIRSQHAARKAAPVSGIADFAFRTALQFKNRIANLRSPDWSSPEAF
ncbi:glycosyltransferase family 10 domain-containing protein [Martelella soudanensis]|uniref:glycosyltransferase family 10 domain-containing protein n=1 Tax=unclassified Martelella TaxID=2629616 RepID=UPI001FF04C00|nr:MULTISPECIES: glycosyltransferase family 10 [unclassified Martelella]